LLAGHGYILLINNAFIVFAPDEKKLARALQ